MNIDVVRGRTMYLEKANKTEFQVIIIGAGVLGLSLAYHLGTQGVKTLVLEKEPSFGWHASGKNAGMVRKLYRHPQLTEWADRSVQTWPNVIRDVAFQQTGSLIVGRTRPGHHRELFEERVFDSGEGVLPAIYSPSDGLLDPHLYLSALLQATNRRFVEYRFSERVCHLEHGASSWHLETKAGKTFRSAWIVNAAGAWVNDVLKSGQPEEAVEVEPFARHLFVTSGWASGYMPASKIGFFWNEHEEWYMRLWGDTTRLVSVCDKTPGDINAGDIDAFQCNSHELSACVATKLMKALPNESQHLQLERSWHCFRTYARDQLPIWGIDPHLPNFFWLSGFGGFGMSTSYAACADAAQFICGQNITVSPDCSPKRAKKLAARKQAVMGGSLHA